MAEWARVRASALVSKRRIASTSGAGGRGGGQFVQRVEIGAARMNGAFDIYQRPLKRTDGFRADWRGAG